MIMEDTKCSCCGAEKELYQTNDGKYCWIFSWVGGGGNDVWAVTKEDAIKEIASKFSTSKEDQARGYVVLKPNLDSLSRVSYKEWRDRDRAFQMMMI